MKLFDLFRPKKSKVKAKKRHLESSKPSDEKPSDSAILSEMEPQIEETSPPENKMPDQAVSPSPELEMEKTLSVEESLTLSEEKTEDTLPKTDMVSEKEPDILESKSILFVKKIIPEFALKPKDSSLTIFNTVILKNSGTTSALKVKGNIKYKQNDKILANEPIGSNVTLGPNQTVNIENSFDLPLNEIQYIKIANIIKNKQALEIPDVKPVMKVDIHYERENGEESDISQSYLLDFKNNSWRLYI
ncbi:MAG: hypothetical protein V3R82_03135 [Candidatus Hydrothermarchaeales archaeon]